MMDDRQWNVIRPAIARLRASMMAVVFGTLCGLVLFLATAWLLIRGGTNVGQHLGLLSNFFPGYEVTWGGAVLGFAYGAVTGAVLAYVVTWIYNTVALKRLGEGR